MTTTAFDDQFVAGTQTIERIREPYDTVAILRRNVADLELALRTQTERAESYAETLRSLASYVGSGGYNSDTVDADAFEEKIRWGIGEIMTRAEAAEAELAQLAQQEPVAWMDAEGDTYKEEPPENWCPPHVPLYASFAHVMHKGATHCDDCGLTWLDDGLNPLGCPYCKDTVPAPAVPTNTIPEGDDFNGTTPHMIRCIEALVAMDDRGALAPHGLCRHSRTLLLASANRLRQQQAHVVPAVPSYLLERQENGLSWYIGATTCFGGAWHWTTDVNSAIRFSREEDAAACWNIIARHHIGIGGSGTTETTPKQHIFEDVHTLLQSAEVTK